MNTKQLTSHMSVLMTLSSNAIYHGLTQAQTHNALQSNPNSNDRDICLLLVWRAGSLRSPLGWRMDSNAAWHTVKQTSRPHFITCSLFRHIVNGGERCASTWGVPSPPARFPDTKSGWQWAQHLQCVWGWENGMCLCKQQGMKQKKGVVLSVWGRRCGRDWPLSVPQQDATDQLGWRIYFPSSSRLPRRIRIITGRVFLTLALKRTRQNKKEWREKET